MEWCKIKTSKKNITNAKEECVEIARYLFVDKENIVDIERRSIGNKKDINFVVWCKIDRM